jgi:predicted aspartyl protease
LIEGLKPGKPEPQVVAATEGLGKFEITATLRGKKITIILDTGATGNFILLRTITRINAPI